MRSFYFSSLINFKKREIKIWVEEICAHYYNPLRQISGTSYSVLYDVNFLSRVQIYKLRKLIKENLIFFVLGFGKRGIKGVNALCPKHLFLTTISTIVHFKVVIVRL